LRKIWQRGHARDDTPEVVAAAYKAFMQALKAGANPDDIRDGAITWRDAFETGDGVRFMPQLPGWIVSRGWEKDPPKKRNGYARSNGSAATLNERCVNSCLDFADDSIGFGTSMWGGGR
jgi:hypothetical protein